MVRKRQTEFVAPPPKPKVRKEYGAFGGSRRPPDSREPSARADVSPPPPRGEGPRERPVTQDTRPRYPREERPPRHEPVRMSTPDARPTVPRPPAEPAVAVSRTRQKEEEHRIALRDALANAKKESSASGSPRGDIKSPADVMRERMGVRNVVAQVPEENLEETIQSGPNEEVSHTALRSILYGKDADNNR